MTIDEKITEMARGIAPDVADEDILVAELMTAEAMILNRMYPFGYEGQKFIPERYSRLQVALAIELYTQRGDRPHMAKTALLEHGRRLVGFYSRLYLIVGA